MMCSPLRELLPDSCVLDTIPNKTEEKWRFSPLFSYLEKEFSRPPDQIGISFTPPSEKYWIYVYNGHIIGSELPKSAHTKVLKKGFELNLFEDIELSLYFDFSDSVFIDSDFSVIVQENIRARILTSYSNGAASFISQLAHIKLESAAHLTLLQIQDFQSDTLAIVKSRLYLHENSQLTNFILLKEAQYLHNLVEAQLGYQSELDCRALLLSRKDQKTLFTCDIRHLADSSISNLVSKQVLKDNSTCVFDANTVIIKKTRSCEARQASHALLLDATAQIHTKPHLEIYSDDLSASHGSTVGELDHDAMAYLLSRGIGEKQAKAMLIYAFILELFEDLDESFHKKRVIQAIGGSDEQR